MISLNLCVYDHRNKKPQNLYKLFEIRLSQKTQIIIKADFYISLIWNVNDVNDGK